MEGLDLIYTYFPNLTDKQRSQFEQLYSLYEDWNSKINVISRKDFEFFYERHVLHSLGIAKVIRFQAGSKILDVGTGGGFPGIPLAILFPDSHFWLVDSVGKKIKVVNAVKDALGLTNVVAKQIRAEELTEKFDFVVSRAVTKLPNFIPWVRKRFVLEQKNAFPNGILYLKGGDLEEELRLVHEYHEVHELSGYFKEDFFETKKVVYVDMNS